MEEYVIEFSGKNLKSNEPGYKNLLELFNNIENAIENQNVNFISINLKNINIFDYNLFAVLSAKCSEYINRGKRVKVININQSLYEKLSVYNFPILNNDNNKMKKDNIKYVRFESSQNREFYNYITHIFNQKSYGLPQMTDSLKMRIIDGLGEVFGNVIMHTDSKYVFCCGQITFGTSRRLDITVVNIGKTIKDNVKEFFEFKKMSFPKNCIEWCSESGNTTKINKTGGLGLTILKEFININQGKLQILSDNEYWECGKRKRAINNIGYRFDGTIVNIEFNLTDKKSYRLKTEINVNDIL